MLRMRHGFSSKTSVNDEHAYMMESMPRRHRSATKAKAKASRAASVRARSPKLRQPMRKLYSAAHMKCHELCSTVANVCDLSSVVVCPFGIRISVRMALRLQGLPTAVFTREPAGEQLLHMLCSSINSSRICHCWTLTLHYVPASCEV